MNRTIVVLCGIVTLAAFADIRATAQTPSDSLKGAWQVSELAEGPGSPGTSPFPSLLLFTGRHYSMMAIVGPRPKFAPGQATDADKLATYDAFAGHSGSYEISGNTVTLHPMVSKNEYMIGTTPRAEFKVQGNTLTWTSMLGNARVVTKYRRLD
jgi:hypothetical protein